MSEDDNPLSEQFRSISYPNSEYDWYDTNQNYPGRRVSFHAVGKGEYPLRKRNAFFTMTEFFPTRAGTDVGINIKVNNPKATRHSKIEEHGGYTPVVEEWATNAFERDMDSHITYNKAIGDPLNTTNAPVINDYFVDRMDTVSKHRPNFPRSFDTLSRAQFVAELVAKRVIAGQGFAKKKKR